MFKELNPLLHSELHAEVARRCSRLLPDKDKVCLFDTNKQRHHRQAQFGMQ